MWNDPEDVEDWMVNGQELGMLFGEITDKFLENNNLGLIARAHQLVQDGYKYMFGSELWLQMWKSGSNHESGQKWK